MRQLIDSSGPHVVVALHRHAYALVTTSSSSTATETETTGDEVRGDGSPHAELTPPVTAVELLPPPPTALQRETDGNLNSGRQDEPKETGTKTREKTTNGGEGANERGDGETEGHPAAAADKGGDDAVGDGDGGSTGVGTEVGALACHRTRDGLLLCAVARSDKTLSVYSVPIPRMGDGASTLTVRDRATGNGGSHRCIEPSLVHACEKRVSALSFAPLSLDSPSPIVVVAADLAGDATAFPVVDDHDDAPNQNSERGGDNARGGGDKVTTRRGHRRRLLLGHTGSMLTGIKIVPSSPSSTSTGTGVSMRILTSDRDEKIRVSSFPDSYRVCGYLLGHGAFVSSLDVAVDVEMWDDAATYAGDSDLTDASNVDSPVPVRAKLAISCGGDGTVRLWDYDACRQLDVFNYGVTNGNVNEDEEEGREREQESAGDATDNVKESVSGVVEGRKKNGDGTIVESTGGASRGAGANGDSAVGGSAAAIPTNVALRRDGRVAVVLRNGIEALDVFEVSTEGRAPSTNEGEVRLKRAGSTPCRTAAGAGALPLCATFLYDGTLLVVVKAGDSDPPTYLLQFKVDGGGVRSAADTSPASLLDVSESSPLCRALRGVLVTSPQLSRIEMPSSIVELDGAGQFKLIKAQSVVENKTAWNDASKTERSRAKRSRRGKRRRKRRRMLDGNGGNGSDSDNAGVDESIGGGGEGNDEGDDGSKQ